MDGNGFFEGSLRELVEMSVQEETVCAVEKNGVTVLSKKEERWLRGYEKENLADSLVSWDYVFDFFIRYSMDRICQKFIRQ